MHYLRFTSDYLLGFFIVLRHCGTQYILTENESFLSAYPYYFHDILKMPHTKEITNTK